MINKQPRITVVYDRRKKSSQYKKATLELKVSFEGKSKFVSTGIYLYPNQWKNGCIVNCSDAIQLSQILNDLLVRVRSALMSGSFNTFRERLRNSNVTFMEFCRKRAAVRKYGKEKDTQERYDRFLRLFEEWGGIVEVGDINEGNIIKYDKYLSSKGMKPYSKWNNYHRFLDSFIKDAVSDGLLQRNPYNWINIDRKKQSYGLDKCLTLEEFRKLKEAKMPTESLGKVRDVFVFQTYTCLRYSDLTRFNIDDITTINGMTVYKFCQKKTRKPTVIPLLPPALDILRKYDNRLPLISNVKYNEYLKVVAQAAGLDYKISTHWARHTGATMLLNEGVDMGVVAKICGHSSTRITEQIYAKLLDETVVDAVYKLKI